MTHRIVLVFLFLILCSLPGAGQPLTYEVDERTVLAPIFLVAPVDGANGSRWVSEFRVVNLGERQWDPIQNLGPVCDGLNTCSEDLGTYLSPQVSVVGYLIRGQGQGPGALLFMRPESAVSFQLRVRDTSRDSERRGTWLPIVRRDDARRTPTHLLGVPVDSRYRYTLRVYSFVKDPGLRARIRVYATDPTAYVEDDPPTGPEPLLGEFVLTLSQGMSASPGYAEFSGLSDLLAGKDAREFRVVVEPENGVPMWAMVTITNNVTQEFTAVLPDQVE